MHVCDAAPLAAASTGVIVPIDIFEESTVKSLCVPGHQDERVSKNECEAEEDGCDLDVVSRDLDVMSRDLTGRDDRFRHTRDAAPRVAASPGGIIPIAYNHDSIVKLLLPAGRQGKQHETEHEAGEDEGRQHRVKRCRAEVWCDELEDRPQCGGGCQCRQGRSRQGNQGKTYQLICATYNFTRVGERDLDDRLTWYNATDQTNVKLNKVYDRVTPREDFSKRTMLGLEEDTSWENMGGLKWELVLCVVAAWNIVCLCLIKGVQSSGKVVDFTALFLYLVLVTLLVRGLTRPGAMQGIINE